MRRLTVFFCAMVLGLSTLFFSAGPAQASCTQVSDEGPCLESVICQAVGELDLSITKHMACVM